MVWPTGISAPSCALIPPRTPSPGDSISITALSVSISSRGSPFEMLCPSFLSQAMSLPVSCAISRAGITTLIGIDLSRTKRRPESLVSDSNSFIPSARPDHFFYVLGRFRLALTRGRQLTIHREVMGARNQQLFGRETRDHFVPGWRDYNLFLDARGTPSVRRWSERLQREHHSGLDLTGMVERHEAADDRLLPDRQADSVPILQSEGRLFIRESEVGCLRPHRRDFRRRPPGTHQLDGRVEILTAALVGIDHCVRRISDREAAVVAGAVSHVGMEDVVIHGIAGT